MSNRVLEFNSASSPQSAGSIDLFHLVDTMLVTVDRRMVLRLTFADSIFEFYTDSMMDLYDWEAFTSVAGGFDHRMPPAHAGWLHLLNGCKGSNVQAGWRQYWEVSSTESPTLCAFNDNHSSTKLAQAATCTVQIESIVKLDLVDGDALKALVKGFGKLSDALHFSVDLTLEPSQKLGVQLDASTRKVRSFESGGISEQLQSAPIVPKVGDVVVAIDGVRLDSEGDLLKALAAVASKDDGVEQRLVTVSFRRPVPLAVNFPAGAIRIEGPAAQQWILHPAPNGDQKLLAGAAVRQLANWMSSLQTALDKARTRLSQEKVVLESPLDLEWEDEWVKAYIVLSMPTGITFFPKEDSAKAAIAAGDLLLGSVLTMPMPVIRRASHAMGLEFYDGVIDVETESDEMPLVRVRLGSLSALFHNLLSAINIYGAGAKQYEAADGRGGTHGDGRGTEGGGRGSEVEPERQSAERQSSAKAKPRLPLTGVKAADGGDDTSRETTSRGSKVRLTARLTGRGKKSRESRCSSPSSGSVSARNKPGTPRKSSVQASPRTSTNRLSKR
uniref:Uncharacterized protein n=1 Tax=Haptolina ericina TaxID=156174 RepID=A0A6T9D5H5_9EUKA